MLFFNRVSNNKGNKILNSFFIYSNVKNALINDQIGKF